MPAISVGLVAAHREPHTPLVAALLDEAMALADEFRQGELTLSCKRVA